MYTHTHTRTHTLVHGPFSMRFVALDLFCHLAVPDALQCIKKIGRPYGAARISISWRLVVSCY